MLDIVQLLRQRFPGFKRLSDRGRWRLAKRPWHEDNNPRRRRTSSTSGRRSRRSPAKENPARLFTNVARLRADCLKTEGLTVTAAEKLGVARTTLDLILNGRGGISAEMALRLERLGWSNADFRMRYQTGYDLANGRRRARERGEAIVRETRKAGALL